MRRTLGPTQYAMLGSLVAHGSWYGGCGWSWGELRATERILDSLHRRGLVQRREQRWFDGNVRVIYEPTDAGMVIILKAQVAGLERQLRDVKARARQGRQ